jgi:hypothetical protein
MLNLFKIINIYNKKVMKKNVLNEIKEMKYLFGYKPGKVISEQDLPEEDYEMEDDISIYDGGAEDDISFSDDEIFEEDDDDDVMFADPDVMEPEVVPDTDRDVEEKPYNPNRRERDPGKLPNYDPQPQGRRNRSFRDEVEYELEFEDGPKRRPMRRMRDMDENIYEIEIDGDIAELFKK